MEPPQGNPSETHRSAGKPSELSLLSEESLDDVEPAWNNTHNHNHEQNTNDKPVISSNGKYKPQPSTPNHPPTYTSTTPSPEASISWMSSEFNNQHDIARYEMALSNMTQENLEEYIMRIKVWAQRLGVLEAKEMERGAVLNVLGSHLSHANRNGANNNHQSHENTNSNQHNNHTDKERGTVHLRDEDDTQDQAKKQRTHPNTDSVQ